MKAALLVLIICFTTGCKPDTYRLFRAGSSEINIPWIDIKRKTHEYVSWTVSPRKGLLDNGGPLIGTIVFSLHTQIPAKTLRIKLVKVTDLRGAQVFKQIDIDVSLQAPLYGKSKYVDGGNIWVYVGPEIEIPFQKLLFECEVCFLDEAGAKLSNIFAIEEEIINYTQNLRH